MFIHIIILLVCVALAIVITLAVVVRKVTSKNKTWNFPSAGWRRQTENEEKHIPNFSHFPTFPRIFPTQHYMVVSISIVKWTLIFSIFLFSFDAMVCVRCIMCCVWVCEVLIGCKWKACEYKRKISLARKATHTSKKAFTRLCDAYTELWTENHDYMRKMRTHHHLRQTSADGDKNWRGFSGAMVCLE